MTQVFKPLYWFWVAILFVLVVFYSTYRLTESPPTWFDEGLFIQAALSLLDNGTEGLQVAPGVFEGTAHITGGYPFLAPVAVSMKFFGNSLFAARLPMVLFILLLVAAVFLLIYRLYGPREALWSLLLLGTFPLLYGNGKNVLGEVPGLLYTVVALYFLWKVEEQEYQGYRWYIGAGLFIGLATASKPIFFLLPLAVGLVAIGGLLLGRIPLRVKELTAAAVAFIAPLVLWAYFQFGAGDTIAAVFSHYANPYAETSLVHVVVQNFLRFFKEATPLYCAALSAVWLGAVAIRLYTKEKIRLVEWSAFIFSLLILLAYLRTEGWYRYFFEAMLLALIFLPSSLTGIARSISNWMPAKIRLWPFVVVILLAGMQIYQLNFSSWVAEHNASTETANLERFFATFSLNKTVLVYNAPEIVPFLPALTYYQYFELGPTEALAFGKENRTRLLEGLPDEVIVSPSNYESHAELFERYKFYQEAAGYYILQKR